ncbi:MAG: hypothetical protein LAO55_27855 [Acidobacteriia bacterium]|nr:hypothetical protein [Terriglobia bacterium]
MSRRLFTSTVAALTVLVMLCAQPPASAQTAPVATKAPNTAAGAKRTWTPPHTPDGHPDMQGYWTNNTLTPLERPKELGAKEFYTEAEVADLMKKDQTRLALNEEEGRPTEPGTTADVHYDYTQFALDRGQAKLSWNRRTSMIVGERGILPPMLPEASKRNADIAAKNRGHELDGPENISLSSRCIVVNQESVPMLSGGYNNNLQIVQAAGVVAIMNEMNHSVRIVPIDGRQHPSAGIRQFKGDSIGHWEGDTLVVDSTNFTARNSFHGSGDKLHVVERFTRVDADTIVYRFTVEDPETWDQPWTAETAWSKVDGPIFEYACHEGNYSLRNTLHGARVAEEEAAQKKAGK